MIVDLPVFIPSTENGHFIQSSCPFLASFAYLFNSLVMAENAMLLTLYLYTLKNIYHFVTDFVYSAINISTDLLNPFKMFDLLLLFIMYNFFKIYLKIDEF